MLLRLESYYIGVMENEMEATIMGYIGIIGYILGLYWGNGKENGNYYSILGLYRRVLRGSIVFNFMTSEPIAAAAGALQTWQFHGQFMGELQHDLKGTRLAEAQRFPGFCEC